MIEDFQNIRFLVLGLISALTAIFLAFIRKDMLWLAVSSIFLFLVVIMSKVRKDEKIRFSALQIGVVPLLLRAAASIYRPVGDIAFFAIIPILSFMTLLCLIYNSDFETNFYFSSGFIFFFSLTLGSIIRIGDYIFGNLLENSYQIGNEQLMKEFIIIILFGLLGSLIFVRVKKLFSDDTSYGIAMKQLTSPSRMKPEYSNSYFFTLLNSYFWSREERSLLLFSRTLQIGILALLLYSFQIKNFWAFSVALILIVISVFISLYSRITSMNISPSFQFWTSAIFFLYVLGETLIFHQSIKAWNDFSHFMAGVIVGSLILIILYYLDEVYDDLKIPPRIIPIFVLAFILSISLLWEVFEFLVDSFAGTNLQAQITDTIRDMIANTLGAYFMLFLTFVFTPFKMWKKWGLLKWTLITLLLVTIGVTRVGRNYRIFMGLNFTAIYPLLVFTLILINLIYYTHFRST